MSSSKYIYNFLIITISFTMSACSSLGLGGNKKAKLAYIERPAEQIYNQGFKRIEKNDWDRAKLFFQEVERQHPFSKWARRAMLMQAYANYRSTDYEESIVSAQRFIGLHPGSDSTPYAYYLIAMNYYDQIYDVGRDQETTVNAEAALQQVVRRYPNSDYARDARLKLELTHDHLAGKEMTIGRYYLKENQHLAAIGRFKNVVKNYETTSQTEEALHRLVEAYVSLGIISEAKLVGSVLGYNYPSGEWYQDSYNLLEEYGVNLDDEIKKPRNKGYWNRLIERLF
ncbi:MAG: outer membrane protein assembly factor BamD [Hellea sp.]|nr:outer membrane protein assembly factor BamD [Hellea sp.]MDG1666592.1 outer membrane protein assembly factor BamD [Hellea sp.]MDG2361390.1 outer membrane protein assembly factor BamD [Hellea sp.]|tara:strand:+ start:435 stop:1286 length:852 start_codon:yes stop_codon:yes gene_type:complete